MNEQELRNRIKGAGGFTAVSKMLKPAVSRQAVWQWANGTKVPPTRVKELAAILNMEPKDIRPDIF